MNEIVWTIEKINDVFKITYYDYYRGIVDWKGIEFYLVKGKKILFHSYC